MLKDILFYLQRKQRMEEAAQRGVTEGSSVTEEENPPSVRLPENLCCSFLVLLSAWAGRYDQEIKSLFNMYLLIQLDNFII